MYTIWILPIADFRHSVCLWLAGLPSCWHLGMLAPAPLQLLVLRPLCTQRHVYRHTLWMALDTCLLSSWPSDPLAFSCLVHRHTYVSGFQLIPDLMVSPVICLDLLVPPVASTQTLWSFPYAAQICGCFDIWLPSLFPYLLADSA